MNSFIPHIAKVFAADIVGTVNNPILEQSYGNIESANGGLAGLLGNALRIFFIVAGIVAFFNFIIAGFQYMLAAGDSKALQSAWDRIWQSLLGLILISGSFALAAVFGWIIFKDPLFMIHPQIYGPK